MNANEVIATLASRRRGSAVHPNDHVNSGQSSNDVIPTAMQVAACVAMERELIPALERLRVAGGQGVGVRRDREVRPHAPHGRDASPARPGVRRLRERRSSHGIRRVREARRTWRSCRWAARRSARGSTRTPSSRSARSRGSRRHRTVLPGGDEPLRAAGHARHHRVRPRRPEHAGRVADAHRQRHPLAGERAAGGAGRDHAAAIQPGSSIMPGKVNPVIPEAVTMVAAQVMGNTRPSRWVARAATSS
jgi:fumarate hydratase, class II